MINYPDVLLIKQTLYNFVTKTNYEFSEKCLS